MREIITDITKLKVVSEPCVYMAEIGQDTAAVDELKDLIADIKAQLQQNDKLFGLAAVQLGVNKRVFCMKYEAGIKTFINPVITSKSPEKFINTENHVDGKSLVYVCRPQSIEIAYVNDELKPETNKMTDLAAATFTTQYNLLDGIIAGEALNLDLDNITVEDVPALIEATYSGSGLVLDTDDTQPEQSEVAEVLTKLISGLFNSKVEELMKSDDETLKKLVRVFYAQEKVMLGYAKIVDQTGWEAEKKAMRKQNIIKQNDRAANFRNFVGKVCK